MADASEHRTDPETRDEGGAEPPSGSTWQRALLLPIVVFIVLPIVLSLIVKMFVEP